MISKNKVMATFAIILFLLMTSVMMLATPIQPAEAQLATEQQSIDVPAGVIPAFTTDTRAFLSFTPNPIGIGQPLLINVWLNPALNMQRLLLSTSTGCYKVTLTKPDGNEEVITMMSTRPDTTSWTQYVPDQVGEWKIKFDFLGTYFPAGQWLNGYMVTNSSGSYINSEYLRPSSSPEFTFTVQSDIVYSWPDLGLPSSYWTWPVDWSHREWWPIMGSYPSTGYYAGELSFATGVWDSMYPDTNPQWSSQYMFYPLVAGPESAHVVWTRQDADGGINGGLMGYYGEWQSPGSPTMVYRGRCYGTYTKPGSENATAYFYCYDLRTGEMYWEYPTATTTTTVQFGSFTFTTTTTLAPQYIAYIEPTLLEAIPESAISQAGWHVEFIGIFGDTLCKWDPWTGNIVGRYNITGSPGGTFHNYINGYVLGVQNLGNSVPSEERYRLINWTTSGSSNSFASRIISNTSYARSSLPSYIDWNAGYGVTVSSPSPDGHAAGIGVQINVFNLLTGVMTQNITSSSELDTPYSGSATCVDHGKVAYVCQGGYLKAWDLTTGRLAWQSEEMAYPWGASAFGVYGIASAYGMVFRPSYDGLYAFNWTNGQIVWVDHRWTRAQFETPYTSEAGGPEVNPGMTNVRIADGKIYIYDGEHSPQWPKIRGFALHCLNVTTGGEIWEMAVSGAVAFGQEPSTGPIAEGYLIMPSTLGTTFVYGKGLSATTVDAPDNSVPLGTALMIKGTVLDQSPAQPGTPCVSKDSMRTQMEYLHLQYPISGLFGNETITGVPVTLTAIDADGTVTTIGTTTTNGYGGTYGMAWIPPNEGTYTILANFAGDDSYGSSMATTALTVGPAPGEVIIPPAAEQIDYTMTITGAAIAAIIAVAIVGLLLFLGLRKR